MLCVPVLSEEVTQVATPVLGLTGTAAVQPATPFDPSMKVTDPDSGIAPVVGETVAVKVTGSFTITGFGEMVKTRLDAALPTLCEVVPLLFAKLVSAE